MDICSIPVGGRNVVYAAAGTTANPPLLLVHGWGASHKFWREVLPAFLTRFYCVAPDLPGFGLSEKPDDGDYTIPGLARSLGKFLDALDIPRCDLVGHSMGGATSIQFALANPGRVRRLCVVNPPMRGEDAFYPFARWAVRPGIRRMMWLGCRIGTMRRFVAKDFTHVAPLGDELVADVGAGSYRSMTQPLLCMMEMDLAARLRELAMPALLIGTDKDLVIRPEQHELWPRNGNFTYARIGETGHIPMLERPAEFNRVLAEFLLPAAP